MHFSYIYKNSAAILLVCRYKRKKKKQTRTKTDRTMSFNTKISFCHFFIFPNENKVGLQDRLTNSWPSIESDQ